MNPSKEARLRACLAELSELLYEDTDPNNLKTLEGIEKSVRQHLLETVGPELGSFLSNRSQAKRQEGNGSSKVASES